MKDVILRFDNPKQRKYWVTYLKENGMTWFSGDDLNRKMFNNNLFLILRNEVLDAPVAYCRRMHPELKHIYPNINTFLNNFK